MDILTAGLEIIYYMLSLLGVIAILIGALEAAWHFAHVRLRSITGGGGLIIETDRIRDRLGAHLLLGLDLFIAADIVRTVAVPTWESIGILAAITVIRVFLSFFLMKELRDTERHIRESLHRPRDG